MDMEKIKCNYTVQQSTKSDIDRLHKELGLPRGVLVDLLVEHYGDHIKRILRKESGLTISPVAYEE